MGLYTQQDPIGIAGGLNLYGYANGDPVNYSDPFGLKAGQGSIDCSLIEDLQDWAECMARQYAAEEDAELAAAQQDLQIGRCAASSVQFSAYAVSDALFLSVFARAGVAVARFGTATGTALVSSIVRSTTAGADAALALARGRTLVEVEARAFPGQVAVATAESAGASAAAGGLDGGFSKSDFIPFTGHGDRAASVASSCGGVSNAILGG